MLEIAPDEDMVATEVGEQLHEPPGSELESIKLLPTQIGEFPVIAPGLASMVTITVAVPQAVLYDTTAVPAAAPVITPEGVIVAREAGERLHVPPAGDPVSDRVLPTQSGELPVIAVVAPLTVTTAYTEPHAVL